MFSVKLNCILSIKEFEILKGELHKYNPELLDKEFVVAITKADMLDDELKEALKAECPENVEYIYISSVAQEGLVELKDKLWTKIEKSKEAEIK